jgi:hypothetical protein
LTRSRRSSFSPLTAAVVDSRPSSAACRITLSRRNRALAILTVFFAMSHALNVLDEFEKIDQLMPIVAETEQIADRRNSPLKSRARNFDGSGRRFFGVSGKNFLC